MSAAWSQYVPERGELVDDPVCDARPLFWDRERPGLERVSTAPIRKRLKIGVFSPQVWKEKVFGLRYSSLIWMLPRCYIEEDRNIITSTHQSNVWEGTMADASSIANNGVNVAALVAAREELTKAPAAAQFKWRAACEWKDGTHSHSTVEGFYGLGQEQHHKKTFTFDADHPELFASEDKGATPVEYVLVGLASCLTAGIAAVAQYRNIQLRSVTATLEGDMDLQGILGIDDDVRNGFGGIKVTYKIDADAKREDIEALVAQSQKRSAVYDIVTNPTNVTVVVD
jgi:uncharacterized OsmC-like protein